MRRGDRPLTFSTRSLSSAVASTPRSSGLMVARSSSLSLSAFSRFSFSLFPAKNGARKEKDDTPALHLPTQRRPEPGCAAASASRPPRGDDEDDAGGWKDDEASGSARGGSDEAGTAHGRGSESDTSGAMARHGSGSVAMQKRESIFYYYSISIIFLIRVRDCRRAANVGARLRLRFLEGESRGFRVDEIARAAAADGLLW